MSPKYTPLLQFLVGLIATSVALVAAAFSVMKDAKEWSDWKASLLSFLACMAVTIFVATASGLALQARRTHRANDASPDWIDYRLVSLPIITGLFAASHLIAFAFHQGAHIFPW
jgi:hypothetical protein